MKKIPLTKGGFAIVDDEDYERVSRFRWHLRTEKKYAITPLKQRDGRWLNESMHRILLDAPEGMDVDHINGDTLDNRRLNLRICTRIENSRNRNRLSSKNTSGITGVSQIKKTKRWYAVIVIEGKQRFLGVFATKEEAAKVRRENELRLFGDFAPKEQVH